MRCAPGAEGKRKEKKKSRCDLRGFFFYSFLASFVATTSHGRGAGLASGMPAALSLSRRARPICHEDCPRFRPQTRPICANASMNNFEGLNWDDTPNSDAA